MQDNSIKEQYYTEDEITLKDVVLKIKDYIQYLWKRKLKIALLAIIGFCVMYAFHFSKPTKFTSGLIFIINEESNPSSALELSEIPDEQYNLSRLIALASSSKITHQALFERVKVNEVVDILANHISSHYGIEERLKITKLEDADSDDLTLIATLHELIAGNKLANRNGFMSLKTDKSQIISLTVTTDNSELSDAILNSLFQHLKEYYIDQTIGSSKRTLELLEDREKQLESQLTISENNLSGEIETALATQNLGLDDRFDLLFEIESEEVELIKEEHRAILLKQKIQALNERKAQLIKDANSAKDGLLNSILKEELLFEKEQQISDLANRLKMLPSIIEKDQRVSEWLNNVDFESIDSYEDINEKLKIFNHEINKLDFNRKTDSILIALKNQVETSNSWRDDILSMIEYEFKKNKFEVDKLKNELDSINVLITTSLNSNNISNQSNEQSSKLYDLTEKVEELLRKDAEAGQLLNQKINDIRFDRLTSELNNAEGIITELRKNKQSLVFNINHRTPEFQILDQTIKPLTSKSSPLTMGIIGSLLGLLLSSLYFILKRTYQLEMAK